MKKICTILTFLILCLPMWQSCETKTAIAENSEITEQTKKSFWAIFDSKAGACMSGYRLSLYFPSCIIETIKEKDYKIDCAKFINSLNFAFITFFLYALISVLLLILAFIKKKEKLFYIFSIINFCIIITSYFLFLDNSNDITQIKYGFYLLIINSGLIFYSNFYKKFQN